jgi:hypothetical protein
MVCLNQSLFLLPLPFYNHYIHINAAPGCILRGIHLGGCSGPRPWPRAASLRPPRDAGRTRPVE